MAMGPDASHWRQLQRLDLSVTEFSGKAFVEVVQTGVPDHYTNYHFLSLSDCRKAGKSFGWCFTIVALLDYPGVALLHCWGKERG